MAGAAEPLAAGLGAAAVVGHVALWGAEAPWGRAELAGALLLVAGLAWIAWAVATLRAAGTRVGSGAGALVLVEDGP